MARGNHDSIMLRAEMDIKPVDFQAHGTAAAIPEVTDLFILDTVEDKADPFVK